MTTELRLVPEDPTRVCLDRQDAEYLAQFVEAFFAANPYVGDDATDYPGSWRGRTLPGWLAMLRPLTPGSDDGD